MSDYHRRASADRDLLRHHLADPLAAPGRGDHGRPRPRCLAERADGRVALWDEDEFDEHRAWWAYPPEVVDAARASADWLLTALADGTEPFAGDYRAWLELVS